MALGNAVLGDSLMKLEQFPMQNQNKLLLISIMINNELQIKLRNKIEFLMSYKDNSISYKNLPHKKNIYKIFITPCIYND